MVRIGVTPMKIYATAKSTLNSLRYPSRHEGTKYYNAEVS